MLFSPFLVKMTLRMVMRQNFWTVSLRENNWLKQLEYEVSNKLEWCMLALSHCRFSTWRSVTVLWWSVTVWTFSGSFVLSWTNSLVPSCYFIMRMTLVGIGVLPIAERAATRKRPPTANVIRSSLDLANRAARQLTTSWLYTTKGLLLK